MPPGPEPGFRWGGIGARFGALLIDAVIVVASEIALSLVMAALGGGRSSGSTPAWATALSLIWVLGALAYHPVCWYVFGATPGQKVLGLKVVRAYDGSSLSLGTVLVRYLLFFFVTVLFPLGIVSGILAIGDPFKRAWHDQVARSVVVRWFKLSRNCCGLANERLPTVAFNSWRTGYRNGSSARCDSVRLAFVDRR